MVVFLHHSCIALIVLVYVICFTLELNGGEFCTYQVTRVRSETKAKSTPRYWPDCPGERAQCHITTYFTSYVEYNEDVDRCCAGWIQDGNNCSLPCTNNTFGQNCSETCNCTSVNSYCDPVGGCVCMAGWKEPNCSSPCDPGSHGYGCRKICNCLHGASCDPFFGSCNCAPGWIGLVDCNVTCPAGRYGNDCLESCTCLEGAVCDPINGSCSCLPDRIGPNCTLLEESTTQQTKGKHESNLVGSDSNDPQNILMVAVSGVSFAVGIAIGFIICILYKRYRSSNHIRGSSTGLTHAQRNDEGATQSGLQTLEAGAQLISSETLQRPDECTISRGNMDVIRMYETTITQSDDRTRNPDEEAPSRVYCDVGEVKTPLQSTSVHNTHCGEIEHTYYRRNTQL